MTLHDWKIRTGDVYLGSGEAKISYLTRWLTNSNFSHSGLLWESDNKILTVEAYKSINKEPPDYLNGKFGKGVQVVDFAERLATYKGGITLLRLKPQYDKYRDIVADCIRRNNCYRGQFCSNFFKLGAAALKLPVQFNSGRSLFCSELVLTVYRDAGIVDKSIEPWKYTPVDLLRTFGFLFEAPLVLKG